jgi:hypothetical protein
MLDVHAPHEATHTWTDFAIHIATICVGLLIAIGLEQSVEYIHRAHERRDLREALYAESAQIVRDGRDSSERADAIRLWTSARIAQLTAALRDNKPVPPASPPRPVSGDLPDDPIWQAAKTSNSAALLNRDELTAYGELSQMCGSTRRFSIDIGLTARTANAYALRFGGRMTTANLSHASREEIQEMIERLGEVDLALQAEADDASATEGAAEAIHNGEHDITRIYAAEKSARKRDDDAFAPRLARAQEIASASSPSSAQ